MMNIEQIKRELLNYDGPSMRIMEVCGSHTEAVAKFGIPSLLSDKIKLLSGPGCPVCVTTSAYIDRLIDLVNDGYIVATFGDLIRVPGSSRSLADVRQSVSRPDSDSMKSGDVGVDDRSDKRDINGRVEMVYSPMDIIKMAEDEPDREFVFAAVGFETTTPVYALLMDEIIERNIRNIKLLTSVKTMPKVIDTIMSSGASIDGFLAPGHVSVVTGWDIFMPIAEKFSIPLCVSGFRAEELLVAIYGIVRHRGQGVVKNYYPSVVTSEGNVSAKRAVEKYFRPADAAWRGLGVIPESGMLLRDEYMDYDAGSAGLDKDEKKNPACHCDQVLMGNIRPYECPLFGKRCNPMDPQGACMVSTEGSCYSYFVNKRRD